MARGPLVEPLSNCQPSISATQCWAFSERSRGRLSTRTSGVCSQDRNLCGDMRTSTSRTASNPSLLYAGGYILLDQSLGQTHARHCEVVCFPPSLSW